MDERERTKGAQDDTDVEAHRVPANLTDSPERIKQLDDDAEGHRFIPMADGVDEDTEGHRAVMVDADEDDVEGHRAVMVQPPRDADNSGNQF